MTVHLTKFKPLSLPRGPGYYNNPVAVAFVWPAGDKGEAFVGGGFDVAQVGFSYFFGYAFFFDDVFFFDCVVITSVSCFDGDKVSCF